jgi:hypothetical protein
LAIQGILRSTGKQPYLTGAEPGCASIANTTALLSSIISSRRVLRNAPLASACRNQGKTGEEDFRIPPCPNSDFHSIMGIPFSTPGEMLVPHKRGARATKESDTRAGLARLANEEGRCACKCDHAPKLLRCSPKYRARLADTGPQSRSICAPDSPFCA